LYQNAPMTHAEAISTAWVVNATMTYAGADSIASGGGVCSYPMIAHTRTVSMVSVMDTVRAFVWAVSVALVVDAWMADAGAVPIAFEVDALMPRGCLVRRQTRRRSVVVNASTA
jgi:hypothetical protein